MSPMGDLPANKRPSVTDKELTVLVTGFGPFQDEFPVNPSFEITQSLPQVLPTSAGDETRINVIAYGTPIRVCYDTVRDLVPKLHESHLDTVDLVLHIGMASGRDYYTVEQIGHRDGYHKNEDLDGKSPAENDGLLRFADCPVDMSTSLNCREVLRKWRSRIEALPADSPAYGADCRPSHDAGNYLCDYLYFNSLAWYGRRSGTMDDGAAADRPVLFLHVPAQSDEQTLARGNIVTLALIDAMVEELRLERINLQA